MDLYKWEPVFMEPFYSEGSLEEQAFVQVHAQVWCLVCSEKGHLYSLLVPGLFKAGVGRLLS